MVDDLNWCQPIQTSTLRIILTFVYQALLAPFCNRRYPILFSHAEFVARVSSTIKTIETHTLEDF